MREICLIICENTIKSFPRGKAGPEQVAQLMTMKVTTLTTRKEEFACKKIEWLLICNKSFSRNYIVNELFIRCKYIYCIC